jgi:hypothetical protein
LRGDLEKAGAYHKESIDFMTLVSGVQEKWQRNQFY